MTKINEFEYTEKEIQMLTAFYQSSIDSCGVCDDEENMSYNNANDLQEELGWSKQAIGGVMASLLQKGVIMDCGDSARGSRLNDFILCDNRIAEYFNNI